MQGKNLVLFWYLSKHLKDESVFQMSCWWAHTMSGSNQLSVITSLQYSCRYEGPPNLRNSHGISQNIYCEDIARKRLKSIKINRQADEFSKTYAPATLREQQFRNRVAAAHSPVPAMPLHLSLTYQTQRNESRHQVAHRWLDCQYWTEDKNAYCKPPKGPSPSRLLPSCLGAWVAAQSPSGTAGAVPQWHQTPLLQTQNGGTRLSSRYSSSSRSDTAAASICRPCDCRPPLLLMGRWWQHVVAAKRGSKAKAYGINPWACAPLSCELEIRTQNWHGSILCISW